MQRKHPSGADMRPEAFALWALIAIACSICAGGPAAAADRSAAAVRVLSFNVRYNTPRDGRNAWPHRKKMAADIFKKYSVDVAGLQEPDKRQIDDLKKRLPDWTFYGVKNAIVYQSARFELVRGGTFWLSKTPDRKSRGWDGQEPRLVRWAQVRERSTARTWFFFNTHFDNRGKTARERSAALVIRKIREISGSAPAILLGDFNCGRESKPYQTLTTAGGARPLLKDARDISKMPPTGPPGTFNGFKKTAAPKRAIDFIFVTGAIDVLSHTVIADSQNGRYPSDHFPVTAQVLIHPDGKAPERVMTDPLYVRAYNVDDFATITVNGTDIVEAGYQEETGWIPINDYLVKGDNHIRFALTNSAGGWTFGFELKLKDTLLWKDECGQAGSRSCARPPGTTVAYEYDYVFKVK
ncbi:MAG: hypothetical protein A3G34_10130 [Candidatus Lindowbacteria bacterium RIFCSPLOWO2_12_FULL_62_27]|nr:MAG: hypothetical protein A3G34_10130 [Candidatus Lindowbacteria bacterium RIFCSPLOWO2_12_FULL_62_27]